MKLKVSESAKKNILDGGAPFIKKKGKSLFIKFDKIAVNPASGEVYFSLKDLEICHMALDPHVLGTLIVIEGIKGRLPVDLS